MRSLAPKWVIALLLVLLCPMREAHASRCENELPQRPAAKSDNTWYCYNNSDTAVVFVHGLHSGSVTAWLAEGDPQKPAAYWPRLVVDDANLHGPSVFLAGYYTAPNSAAFGMREAAAALRTQLATRLGARQSVLDKRNLLFVGHSLGGVLVRDILTRYAADFQGKRVGLLLAASPSNGSKYADRLVPANWLSRSKIIDELRQGSRYLLDLESDFNRLRTNRPYFLAGREIYEHRFVELKRWGLKRMLPDAVRKRWPVVVDQSSAARYFEDPRLVPNSNHLDIVKPDGFGHLSHSVLVELYKQTKEPDAPQWRVEHDRRMFEKPTFIGKPILLRWHYEKAVAGGAGSIRMEPAALFEVESARDAAFTADARREFIADGNYKVVASVNATRFWRVRALDGNKRPISGWSPEVEIEQYDSAYRRIKATRRLSAYVISSENPDFFKWLDKGTHRGYDAELVKAIAAAISARLGDGGPVVPATFAVRGRISDLLETARQGRADLIMGGITKRKKRERDHRITFSLAYFCTGQALVYRAGEVDRPIREMLKGKTVGFQRETTSADLVRELSRNSVFEVKPLERSELVIQAILDAEVHYGVVDTPYAATKQLETRIPGTDRLMFKEFKRPDMPASLPEDEQRDDYALAVREGDELLDVINEAIAKFRKDGTLKRLLEASVREFENAKGIPTGLLGRERSRDHPWVCS